MHYLYILCSEKSGRYYVGQTQNVKNRLSKHNKGHSEAKKNGIPWGLKKVIEFESKFDALKAEKWLKSMKSRRVTKQVIEGEIDLFKMIGD